MSFRKILHRLGTSRVGNEAQDVFWSGVSGTGWRRFAEVVLVTLCMFEAAVFVFMIMGFRSFGGCRINTVTPLEYCSTLSILSLLKLLPAILTAPALSYFWLRRLPKKIFQTSATSTSLLLIFSAIALHSLGIGGGLLFVVLSMLFVASYIAYRLAIIEPDTRRRE